MKVLVINAGSSSLKYQLFDMDTETMLAKGNCERIGIDGSFLKAKAGDKSIKIEKPMPTHKDAMEMVLDVLIKNKEMAVVKDIKEISAIGHRCVHGGPMVEPLYVDDNAIQRLLDAKDFAPLHIPGAVTGIKACREIAPEIPNIVIFDTEFHATMPEEASTYALPYEYKEKYGVKRYGAHGSSHKYIATQVAKLEGRNDLKIISCHIGSGSSICAIKDGKCIDTSMGFTPLAGVVMGTRCGDIDPALVDYLCQKTGQTSAEITKIMNKKSGMLGISGYSDSRDVESNMIKGDKKAKLAFDIVAYSILKYIGAYNVVLGGADVIVFTAGLGENSNLTREAILDKLGCLGVKYSKTINNRTVRKPDTRISLKNSKIKVWVIPTNEELVIARETLEEIKKHK